MSGVKFIAGSYVTGLTGSPLSISVTIPSSAKEGDLLLLVLGQYINEYSAFPRIKNYPDSNLRPLQTMAGSPNTNIYEDGAVIAIADNGAIDWREKWSFHTRYVTASDVPGTTTITFSLKASVNVFLHCLVFRGPKIILPLANISPVPAILYTGKGWNVSPFQEASTDTIGLPKITTTFKNESLIGIVCRKFPPITLSSPWIEDTTSTARNLISTNYFNGGISVYLDPKLEKIGSTPGSLGENKDARTYLNYGGTVDYTGDLGEKRIIFPTSIQTLGTSWRAYTSVRPSDFNANSKITISNGYDEYGAEKGEVYFLPTNSTGASPIISVSSAITSWNIDEITLDLDMLNSSERATLDAKVPVTDWWVGIKNTTISPNTYTYYGLTDINTAFPFSIMDKDFYSTTAWAGNSPQLTPPSGKSVSNFNGLYKLNDRQTTDAIDLGTNEYAEIEWSLATRLYYANPLGGNIVSFRLVELDGTPLDTYSVTITNNMLYSAALDTQWTQNAFIFRNDDGSESTATSLAAQDTNISQAQNQAFRLRVSVDKNRFDYYEKKFRLQFRKSGDSSWEDV